MDNKQIIDDRTLDISIYEEVKARNRTYFKIVIVLNLILNILYFISETKKSREDIQQIIEEGFVTLSFGLTVLSMIAALVFSFLPYKELKWGQKYMRTLLFILILCNVFFILGIACFDI